jgi:hypothetical protein
MSDRRGPAARSVRGRLRFRLILLRYAIGRRLLRLANFWLTSGNRAMMQWLNDFRF